MSLAIGLLASVSMVVGTDSGQHGDYLEVTRDRAPILGQTVELVCEWKNNPHIEGDTDDYHVRYETLLYDVAFGSVITPCITIDKPL